MGRAAGPSFPRPSSVAINLRDVLRRAPRVVAASFVEDLAVVTFADGHGRFEIRLPALIRGRVVVSLSDLVEVETKRPLLAEEVVDE